MNARQFLKFVIAFGSVYWTSHLMLYISNAPVEKILDEILQVSMVMATIGAAMSFAMFTYVDNMSKDLMDVRNDVDKAKYQYAQASIGAMKKEVLTNAAFLIGLCLLERVTRALALNFLTPTNGGTWLQSTFFISLRTALFAIAMWSAICQIRGFLIAVEFRTLIATNRK